MYLSVASCYPNCSQQSIWASQGRAAEGSELQSFCDHCTGTIFLRFPEPGGIYQKQAFLVYSCLAAVWLSFLLAMDQASFGGETVPENWRWVRVQNRRVTSGNYYHARIWEPFRCQFCEKYKAITHGIIPNKFRKTES